MTEAAASAVYHSLQAQADYPLRKDAFVIPLSTSYDNFKMALYFWQLSLGRHYFLSSTLVTFPTTLYLLCCSLKLLSGAGAGPAMRCAAVAASLAPLALHLIGVDFARWSTLATTTSFLVFTTAALNLRPVTGTVLGPSRNSLFLPGVLIAFSLGSSIPLFDGYVVQSFPYEERMEYVRRLASGGTQFPPRPGECSGVACVTIEGFLCTHSAVTPKRNPDEQAALRCIDRADNAPRPPWLIRLQNFPARP